MDDFDKCEVKDGKIIIDLQTLKDAYIIIRTYAIMSVARLSKCIIPALLIQS